MYQTIYVDKRPYFRYKQDMVVHIIDDEKGYFSFPTKQIGYEPYPTGEYKTVFGERVRKIHNFQYRDPTVIESDVPIETRVLIDLYKDSEKASTKNRVILFDIEVDSRNGFPNVEIADNEITAISLYYQQEDKYYCLILDKEDRLNSIKEKDNITIIPLKTECELLKCFVGIFKKISPTIISGWNSEGFDVPYLIRRMYKICGKDITNSLSPIGIIEDNKKFGTLKIACVSHCDYLLLFKNYILKEHPSYALNAIGKTYVNTGKVEYTGSLDDLYRDNIDKFIEYNINDVVIIKKLDDKFKYIDLAVTVCSECCVPYEMFDKSTVFLDGVILKNLRHKGLVSKNKPFVDKSKKEDKFKGAYVYLSEENKGVLHYVVDGDATSLYPSLIRTCNISFETLCGHALNWDPEKYIIGESFNVVYNEHEYNSNEFINYVRNNNLIIAANGALYTKKQGIIPEILEMFFNKRVECRKLEEKYGLENNKEMHEFYNRLQKSYKVLLNSIYGCMGEPSFRFYCRLNAEATTSNGQFFIKSSAKMVNHFFKKELIESTSKRNSYVEYCDTDSLFFSTVPLIKKYYPDIDENNENLMVEKTLEVAKKVMNFLNTSYDKFCNIVFNTDIGKHYMNMKQEVVSKSSFWIAKKKYVQHIIHEGKIPVDKMECKGVDTQRSSFPKKFSEFLMSFMKNILDEIPSSDIDKSILSFERKLKQVPVIELAKNTSVHFQSDDGNHIYHDNKRKRFEYYKGTPAQVKAALFYNDLIDEWKLNKKVEKIKDGQKIKWVYLKNNTYGSNQIAIKADDTDPEEIMDYIKENIDRRELYERELKTKIMAFYDILHWDYPTLTKELYNSFR